jgi:hypothetical protein
LHERYHHRVEIFSTKLEIVERQPRYVPYGESVYCPSVVPLLTDNALEEGLAVAEVWRALLLERPFSTPALLGYLGPRLPVRTILLRLVEQEIKRATLPPGYRTAMHFISNGRFDVEAFKQRQHTLCAMVQQACQNPLSRAGDWEFAPGLFGGEFVDLPTFILVNGQYTWFPRSFIRKVQSDARKVIRQARDWGIRVAPERQRRGTGDHVWLANSHGDTNHIDTGRDSLSAADWRALFDLVNRSWEVDLKDNSQGRRTFFDGPERAGAKPREAKESVP